MEIRVKRIYEPPQPVDGYRLLVDRLWPRGVSRESASLDAWMKEIAPSSELRNWFGHDASRWREFKRRYAIELGAHQDLVVEFSHSPATIRSLSYTQHETVTTIRRSRWRRTSLPRRTRAEG